MFRRPFSFKGRIRRLEYNLSVLLYLALITTFTFVRPDQWLPDNVGDWLLRIVDAALVPLGSWSLLAQGAKRCHDRNNTAFFQLSLFYQGWMLLAPGTHGPSDYGPDPKAPAAPQAANPT